jgi:hypothetical protein
MYAYFADACIVLSLFCPLTRTHVLRSVFHSSWVEI